MRKPAIMGLARIAVVLATVGSVGGTSAAAGAGTLGCNAGAKEVEATFIGCVAGCQGQATARSTKGIAFDLARCEGRCEQKYDAGLARLACDGAQPERLRTVDWAGLSADALHGLAQSAERQAERLNAIGDPRKNPKAVKERLAPKKPVTARITDGGQPNVIVVKFHEGTRVRQRGGKLVAEVDRLSSGEEKRLARTGLDRSTAAGQVEQVNQVIADASMVPGSRRHLVRLFARPEEDLDREKDEGEALGDHELADLNLYYRVYLDGTDAGAAESLIDELNAMDVVEIAYAEPIGEDTGDIAPPSGDLSGSQGYLGAAPNGINAYFAWSGVSGSRGTDVRVIDIEQNWLLTHEDLPPVFYSSGGRLTVQDTASANHGAAVLGIVAAMRAPYYGMEGIASESSIGVSSVWRQNCYPSFSGGKYCVDVYDLADAVNRAAAQLRSGDLMIIEQQIRGPASGQTCTCTGGTWCNQFESVPVEYSQANFDAIRNATSRGVVVMEAAGNGSMNLDSSIYDDAFNRTVRDSGAIIVGAGTSNGGLTAECWTNYGNRVDVQGWGDSVATLGYGDFRMYNGNDQRQWYTNTFNGTSSATPIVTGAAASLQGFRRAKGLSPLTAQQMRDVLRATGTKTPQAAAKPIGPLPDLRRAIQAHGVLQDCEMIYPSGTQYVGNFVAPDGDRDYCFWGDSRYIYSFTTCGAANFDTFLEVRTGYTENYYSSIVASNDDYCGLQSQLTFTPSSTGQYRLRVRGYGASWGNFTLAYSATYGAALPYRPYYYYYAY